jgi:hypothetical protein
LQDENANLQHDHTQSAKNLDSLAKRHDRVKSEAKRIASENFVLIDQYRAVRQDLDNLETRSDMRVKMMEQSADTAEVLIEGLQEVRV